MHKCVCSNQCNKKGGCAVRESCQGCPALHRRAGPLAPRDNRSLAEGHLFFLVSVGSVGRVLVASLVCAAWHDMVTYLLLAPCSFPSLFFRVMRVLSPLCSLRGCNILISPTSLRVPCVAAALRSLCKTNGRVAAGVLSCHGILSLPSSVSLILLRWCGMLPTYASYVFSPLLFLTVLCLLQRILACVVWRRFISYLHSTRLHTPLWPLLFVVQCQCQCQSPEDRSWAYMK